MFAGRQLSFMRSNPARPPEMGRTGREPLYERNRWERMGFPRGDRRDEAVQAATFQLTPQVGEALRRCRRRPEPVVGPRKLGSPRGQGVSQFDIGLRVEQFRPLRSGKAFRRRGHAAHQGLESRRVRWLPASAQQLNDVI